MTEDNTFHNRENEDHLVEQKNQFRNFVESVTGSYSGNDGVNEDKARMRDDQNRLIDQHNLRK